jgi:SAM-dependent methyltransferase
MPGIRPERPRSVIVDRSQKLAMTETPWFVSFFGDDYLEIYEEILPRARTEAEVAGLVALLDLEPGARILDVACGHGRHAIPLSKQGYRMTGYDLSPVSTARAQARAQAAPVRWLLGDMRDLPFHGEFDVAINVFTALGYFDDSRCSPVPTVGHAQVQQAKCASWCEGAGVRFRRCAGSDPSSRGASPRAS